MGTFKNVLQEIDEQNRALDFKSYNSHAFNIRKIAKIQMYKNADRFEFLCHGELLYSVYNSEINLKFLETVYIGKVLLFFEGTFTVSEILHWEEVHNNGKLKVLIFHLKYLSSINCYPNM